MTVLDSFKLDGRIALVTGTARGLGQGIAVGLVESGAGIAALDVFRWTRPESRSRRSAGNSAR